MSPKKFHEACHLAAQECPQFREYDDDTFFANYGEFGDIPKKGMAEVIRFWRDQDILWDKGYSECLPADVWLVFEKIDKAVQEILRTA